MVNSPHLIYSGTRIDDIELNAVIDAASEQGTLKQLTMISEYVTCRQRKSNHMSRVTFLMN